MTETHIVLVGTKPDIIKQAPIYAELAGRGLDVKMCHTGQHYNFELSGALFDEFDLKLDENFRSGEQPGHVASHIIAHLAAYLSDLKEKGRVPILYPHGDTTTAMAGAVAAFTTKSRVVHVEAGLRTLSPRSGFLRQWLDGFSTAGVDLSLIDAGQDPENYERGSREPNPEQFNTRVVDAAAQLHAAPTSLNERYLLDEGFSASSVAVVGNSVVDAMRIVQKRSTGRVFERYPQLLTARFVRFCVHRQENTQDEKRFRALMDGLQQLLESGVPVLFIRLVGTEAAIDRYEMRSWLESLQRRFGAAFITGPVWDRYEDVVEAMAKCAVVATDSGSIQEEVNVLGVPCVTLRYGSDRGETLLAGSNYLAPPVSGKIVANVILSVWNNEISHSWEPIYPENASALLVDSVISRINSDGLDDSEEWRLGIKDDFPWL